MNCIFPAYTRFLIITFYTNVESRRPKIYIYIYEVVRKSITENSKEIYTSYCLTKMFLIRTLYIFKYTRTCVKNCTCAQINLTFIIRSFQQEKFMQTLRYFVIKKYIISRMKKSRDWQHEKQVVGNAKNENFLIKENCNYL